ncbi:M20 family metallopeptidase [Rhodococcus olei]|uniref:Peptidase M20 domain-containing protein 2 n=1 Tax=Rhodococcus olei TaxID=2161675 RepID=A0ABP8PPG7_9NOCA
MTTPTATDAVRSMKLRAADRINADRARIAALSHDIHAHPETAFTEEFACERISRDLESTGFTVTRGAYGVATAFEAVYGTGRFRVVLCAEYDALPDLGHACGHNIIAAAAVGAATALRANAEPLDLTVVVLGTPAEEHGGGKVALLRGGAFETAVMAAMLHPSNAPTPANTEVVTMQCVDRIAIEFEGRSAHAAIAPHEAINASDAAHLTQLAIAMLRQQLRDGIRVAAVTSEAGTVTNIIPARARLDVEIRSRDDAEMVETKRRVLECARGAAIATGCSHSHRRTEPRYMSIQQDPIIARAWNENVELLGEPSDPHAADPGGSTDMGNVSRVVPSIHPFLRLHGAGGPPHTTAFADAAAGPAGIDCAVTGATLLAWTVLDVAADPTASALLLDRRAARPAGATARDFDGDRPRGRIRHRAVGDTESA